MSIEIIIPSQLIKQLINDDESAFKGIYDLVHQQIYRMLFSLLKDEHFTEEILQETFIRLWLNRKKLNENQSLYPYIYLIAKRLAIDHFRKVMTESDVKNYLTVHAEDRINNTEESVDYSELNQYLDRVIQLLPKQQKTVFILSCNEGLSYDEIAERMQISRNTVKNHLISARKTLKLYHSSHFVSLILFFAFL